MTVFRFNFNTKHAIDLRNAVNDRQKQSIDNIHKEARIKGLYSAWDRTCAAMDRLDDTISYLNHIELGKDRDSRSAFDFYDFINNAYIIIECIKTIGRIFRIKDEQFKYIEKSSSIFGKQLGEASTDGSYFEYIRSLCSVHPLCTNRQSEFLNDSKFHCCPFVTWNKSLARPAGEDADLTAVIYPSDSRKETIRLGLNISQFEQFLTKWIELIPKIIEAKNQFTDNEYERLRAEPVKSLSNFANNVIQYLEYLKGEYCKRFDNGSDYLFDQCIRVFSIEISDKRNKELLAKYQNAIVYSLQFVRNELQNMSYEGYENTGINYPDPSYGETTLFDALCNISPYNSSFADFGYNLGKLYYLENDYDDPYDKNYARQLLNEPKELINQYVHFDNKESNDETIVLITLAQYLESLTRKCLINRNIPNELDYRVKKLSQAQLEEITAEEKSVFRQDMNEMIEEFKDLIEEYGR